MGINFFETMWTERARTLAFGLAVMAALLFGLLLVAKPAHAATFTVNSTGDGADADTTDNICDSDTGTPGEQCTLRAAIQQANATSGADEIHFSIPGSGVHTITPTSSNLPAITEQVTIDGYTQDSDTSDTSDDAKPNTLAVGNNAVLKIELDGTNASDGLRIQAADSTVKGLVINRWGVGVRISGSGATGNKVEGNYIGTNPSGTADLGNTQHGVVIEDSASNNTVGGTVAGTRNTISGNDDVGVGITSTAGTGNKLQGNYIGTKANGTEALGNVNYGVVASTNNNTVGGTVAGARNVISGNNGYGVYILGTGNKVQGNYIGTEANGTAPLGNNNGVVIDGVAENTIGGTTATARNVISGNFTFGIRISFPGAADNKVQGNYIGTDVNGTVIDSDGIPNNGDELGNGLDGVRIQGDADDNTIGGTTAGAGNIISGNGVSGTGGDGVEIRFDNDPTGAAAGNRILSNSIYDNDALGIDLVYPNDPPGVTPNDAGDGDGVNPDGMTPDAATLPNRLQNFPVITSAKLTTRRIGGHRRKVTVIKGTLNSEADETYNIQFFSSPTADLSGFGEGKRFLGQESVKTTGSGGASFTFITRKKVPRGQVVTATATNQSTGDTSEFSRAKTVS